MGYYSEFSIASLAFSSSFYVSITACKMVTILTKHFDLQSLCTPEATFKKCDTLGQEAFVYEG